jgi:IclR helix-turn-helix domain
MKMAVLSSPYESVEYPDRFIYVTTTLLHIRPFDALQVELLHHCQTPISLQALAALSGLSPATVLWLLAPLARHGMVKRTAPPLSLGEEGEVKR